MIHHARHAETTANAAGQLVGSGLDPGLTERGWEQAQRLAAAVTARTVPRRIICSPLARTQETASLVADQLGIVIETDDRLREIAYGEWEGLGVAHLASPEGRRWRTDPTFAPPGGESLRAVSERVAAVCEELVDGVAVEHDVLLVSHVSPIKAAVAWAIGADESVVWRMFLANASITTIGVRPEGQPFLAGFNDTAHLNA